MSAIYIPRFLHSAFRSWHKSLAIVPRGWPLEPIFPRNAPTQVSDMWSNWSGTTSLNLPDRGRNACWDRLQNEFAFVLSLPVWWCTWFAYKTSFPKILNLYEPTFWCVQLGTAIDISQFLHCAFKSWRKSLAIIPQSLPNKPTLKPKWVICDPTGAGQRHWIRLTAVATPARIVYKMRSRLFCHCRFSDARGCS